jgi:hypothetical protein
MARGHLAPQREHLVNNQQQQKGQQQQQQPKVNVVPAVAIFGTVEFAKPARLNKVEKYGRISCPCITAIVPIVGTGLAVETAMWAERKETKDGVEVEFSASLPRGFKPFGNDSDDARENFIAHVEGAAARWAGFESATDAALELLTGIKSAANKNKPTRTRLVKRPTVERPADQPAAA